jgi:hypothetical protein
LGSEVDDGKEKRRRRRARGEWNTADAPEVVGTTALKAGEPVAVDEREE